MDILLGIPQNLKDFLLCKEVCVVIFIFWLMWTWSQQIGNIHDLSKYPTLGLLSKCLEAAFSSLALKGTPHDATDFTCLVKKSLNIRTAHTLDVKPDFYFDSVKSNVHEWPTASVENSSFRIAQRWRLRNKNKVNFSFPSQNMNERSSEEI